jgi:predicted short-subunit dehydrogenase-like oxidoreductase (DUF2520 family)
LQNARHLASLVNANYTSNISDINKSADLYIIAIKDDAIRLVANKLKVNKNAIVVHTSGLVSSEVLSSFKSYGVFYPLQTFTKNHQTSFQNLPVVINASSVETLKKLKTLSESIHTVPYEINDEDKKYLHLAAVFANNFSNLMFAIAEDITAKHHIPFSILKPLINETTRKLDVLMPHQAQTGPARRKDYDTISQHIDLLRNHPNLRQLYEIASQAIQAIQNNETTPRKS